MSLSPNRNYDLQSTGSNNNTWGVVNNANFSIVDLNLGGRLSLDVSGSSNVTVTANQAQNLMHVLSGTLTGNIDYIFPAQGGFYLVQNGTGGSYTITAKISGSSDGVVCPQGVSTLVFCNPDDPSIAGQVFGGSNYFAGGSGGGTANAQTISSLSPAGFTFTQGNIISYIPPATNTGATTLNAESTGAIAVKKITNAAGFADLEAGDIKISTQAFMMVNATSNYYVLLNPALGAFSNLTIGSNFQNNAGALDFSATPVLPTGTTGTTQTVADNSTKVATTAYVDRSGNNSQGIKTVSSSAPSGGSNGDIWYQT